MHKVSTRSLIASGTYYETETGTGVDVSPEQEFCAVLYCSAVTGAPTSLDVKLQGSYDGTNYGDFKTALAFTQLTTATATQCLRFTFAGKWIRAVATIVGGADGTKEYTFSVLMHGKTLD